MIEQGGSDSRKGLTIEEALERIRTSPPLRKVKAFLDRTDLSADIKALLYDIAKITIKVGQVVVAVGRRVLQIAMTLIEKFPNTTLGVIVAVLLTTVVANVLSWAPLFALVLNKLIFLLGLTAGAIEDIRQNAMREAMDRVATQFAPFNSTTKA